MREDIRKSRRHWRNMIKYVKAYEGSMVELNDTMYRDIKEDWYANSCPLCKKYIDNACYGCPLKEKYFCFKDDSPRMKVVYAGTKEEWLIAADKMLKALWEVKDAK